MDCASYLNRILERLLPTHDIVRDYPADGQVVPAYARYESMNEKYVLSRKATLWKAGEYEHVLFFTVPVLTAPSELSGISRKAVPAQAVLAQDAPGASPSVTDRNTPAGTDHVSTAPATPDGLTALAQQLIRDYMEPVLARNNEKYPPKDHMRTFLTAVIISEASPSAELIRLIRKYRFDRGYQFSFRGFSQGRLVFVDLGAGKVYTSPAANDVAEFYRRIL